MKYLTVLFLLISCASKEQKEYYDNLHKINRGQADKDLDSAQHWYEFKNAMAQARVKKLLDTSELQTFISQYQELEKTDWANVKVYLNTIWSFIWKNKKPVSPKNFLQNKSR